MAGKATEEPAKRGRGRPRKAADPAKLETETLVRNLAYVGATVEQIAFVTGLGVRTIERNYGGTVKKAKDVLGVRLRATLVGEALAYERGDRAGASLLMFACKTLGGLVEGVPFGGDDDGRPKGAIIDVTGDEDEDDASGDSAAAPN